MTNAYADSAKSGLSGFDWMSLVPILLIFAVFYFLILRPQQQKNKDQQEMLKGLKKGDRVVTSSGFIGTIDKIVNENEVSLDLGDNIQVRLLRSAVHDVYSGSVSPGSSSSPRSANTVSFPETQSAKNRDNSSTQKRKPASQPSSVKSVSKVISPKKGS